MKIIKTFKDPCQWHNFFCFFPRVITWSDTEFEIAWLETIERRKRYSWFECFWEYRTKE